MNNNLFTYLPKVLKGLMKTWVREITGSSELMFIILFVLLINYVVRIIFMKGFVTEISIIFRISSRRIHNELQTGWNE